MSGHESWEQSACRRWQPDTSPKNAENAWVAEHFMSKFLSVATVGRVDATLRILLFMGLGACVEPFELQRLRLLSEQWCARVSVVDTPGCGYGRTRLSGLEKRALLSGNFAPVARRMVRSAQSHDPQLYRPLTIVGYSLGASIAAAAAAEPGLIQVEQFIVVEPAATRLRNPLRLLRAVQCEELVLDEYLSRNEGALHHPVEPAARRGEVIPHSRVDLALLGYALSRGRLVRDMLHAYTIQAFPVQVVHGTSSRVARYSDVARVIATCRSAGVEVHDVPVAGGHALWHSLPDVAELARLTRVQWS